MHTRLPALSTDELNRKVGISGELSVDVERKALRVYDGTLGGGYEVLGVRAYEPPIGPGPTELIAGDLETGFYGEVGPEEFISYGDLSSQVGLSRGTLFNNEESLWLKYSLDHVPTYLMKRPGRWGLSWNHINDVGCVYGEASVVISGITYLVRLVRGFNIPELPSNPSGYNLDSTIGSEWNRLIYPIHSGIHSHSNHPDDHTDPTVPPFASWASYSDGNLGMSEETILNRGRKNVTMELTPTHSGSRGDRGPTHATNHGLGGIVNPGGWRALLQPL